MKSALYQYKERVREEGRANKQTQKHSNQRLKNPKTGTLLKSETMCVLRGLCEGLEIGERKKLIKFDCVEIYGATHLLASSAGCRV